MSIITSFYALLYLHSNTILVKRLFIRILLARLYFDLFICPLTQKIFTQIKIQWKKKENIISKKEGEVVYGGGIRFPCRG